MSYMEQINDNPYKSPNADDITSTPLSIGGIYYIVSGFVVGLIANVMVFIAYLEILSYSPGEFVKPMFGNLTPCFATLLGFALGLPLTITGMIKIKSPLRWLGVLAILFCCSPVFLSGFLTKLFLSISGAIPEN